MRIYDLHKSLDELIENKNIQVEFIGEGDVWTTHVSKRTWDNQLQRYTYQTMGSCSDPSFLGTYDFAVSCVNRMGNNDDPP